MIGSRHLLITLIHIATQKQHSLSSDGPHQLKLGCIERLGWSKLRITSRLHRATGLSARVVELGITSSWGLVGSCFDARLHVDVLFSRLRHTPRLLLCRYIYDSWQAFA